MLRIFVLMAAAVLPACTSQSTLLNSYTRDERTRVPASIPAFKVTELDGYENPSRPGTVMITMPSGRMMATAMNGASSQWVAMMPAVDAAYRKAGLEVLTRRGRNGCELGDALPLPENFSIQFSYTCKG